MRALGFAFIRAQYQHIPAKPKASPVPLDHLWNDLCKRVLFLPILHISPMWSVFSHDVLWPVQLFKNNHNAILEASFSKNDR
eukprot:2660971-Amphidinium_carterae.1